MWSRITLQRAVRTRQHLMVRTYDDFGYDQFEPVELYDMEEDRFQTTNLWDAQPEIVHRLDHYLAEWLHEQSVKPYAIPDPMQVVLRERQERD